jgi:hypothetical protein
MSAMNLINAFDSVATMPTSHPTLSHSLAIDIPSFEDPISEVYNYDTDILQQSFTDIPYVLHSLFDAVINFKTTVAFSVDVPVEENLFLQDMIKKILRLPVYMIHSYTGEFIVPDQYMWMDTIDQMSEICSVYAMNGYLENFRSSFQDFLDWIRTTDNTQIYINTYVSRLSL